MPLKMKTPYPVAGKVVKCQTNAWGEGRKGRQIDGAINDDKARQIEGANIYLLAYTRPQKFIPDKTTKLT